jgi:hypothetical protein
MHEATVMRVNQDRGAKPRMTLSDGPLPPEGRGYTGRVLLLSAKRRSGSSAHSCEVGHTLTVV